MSKKNSRVQNDVQDRESYAWKKLCDYIEDLEESGADEFSPRDDLGDKLFEQIFTLPESIAKLKRVKKIWLYGSRLKRIPPEIGAMESLEYFDPYTSYDLHWFPYEITKCSRLKESRISTRTLFGNYKNRMCFPSLYYNPVRYFGDLLRCSICGKVMTYEDTNQLWISLRIGTDIVPLLVNLCSRECEGALPRPPDNYVQYAHKGGAEFEQPPDKYQLWEMEKEIREKENGETSEVDPENAVKKPASRLMKTFKLIRKIWEK